MTAGVVIQLTSAVLVLAVGSSTNGEYDFLEADDLMWCRFFKYKLWAG